MSKFFHLLILMLASWLGCIASARGSEAIDAFNRIIPGWTNYSTAFNATHDTGAAGDYATLAALYSPAIDETSLNFSVIVIGGGNKAPTFDRFLYRVLVWDSVEGFISEPRTGDVATVQFAAPTGGSTIVPDAITRGGRGAYRLEFGLTNSFLVLTQNHQYVIGFAALGDTQSSGELFVPTSPEDGPSDLQAGDLVVGGWRYLVDAGGSTIYSGRLAMALSVEPHRERPRLDIQLSGHSIDLTWVDPASEFTLEYVLGLDASATWTPVDAEPFQTDGLWKVMVPARFGQQWFRLRSVAASAAQRNFDVSVVPIAPPLE